MVKLIIALAAPVVVLSCAGDGGKGTLCRRRYNPNRRRDSAAGRAVENSVRSPEIVALAADRGVQTVWDRHWAAVNAGDVAAIMEDYREESVLEVFDKEFGSETFHGLQEIENFFENLFDELAEFSNSSFAVPVINTTDAPAKQTFIIWNINASDHQVGSHAMETFLYAPDNSILRQSVGITTNLLEPAGYSEVTTLTRQPTTSPVVVDPSYAQTSVKAVWDHHWEAFQQQNSSKFMQDYRSDAEMQVFDHSTGTLTIATGLAAIQGMIEEQFSQPAAASVSDPELSQVLVTDVAEGKQVFFAWSSSGIVSAEETFILDEHNKIVRQNAALTSSAPPTVIV